jgi:hypothetical protein
MFKQQVPTHTQGQGTEELSPVAAVAFMQLLHLWREQIFLPDNDSAYVAA